VTRVSFWLYTTRVTTTRSFVALYNVNLGVLFNLFFHAFANLFSANITLCVFYYVRSKKKEEENHPKKWMPFLSCVSHRFILPLFLIRNSSFLFYSRLSFRRKFLFTLDRSEVMYLLFYSRCITKKQVPLICQIKLRSIVLLREIWLVALEAKAVCTTTTGSKFTNSGAYCIIDSSSSLWYEWRDIAYLRLPNN